MQHLRVTLIAAMIAVMAAASWAQNYDWISDLDPSEIQQSNLDKQINSLLEVFSSLAGAGFVNTAEVHRVGGLDVRLSFLGAPVPEEYSDIVPTVTDPLEGEEFASFAVLHGNVGLLPRVEAYARFFTLPVRGEPSTGNVTLIGGGLKFGVLEEQRGSPALVLMGGYQASLVPDDFDFGNVSTWSAKAFLSKSLQVVTLYAGGGVEFTSLSLNVAGLPIAIAQDYSSTYPNATAGLTFKMIPLLRINMDANYGSLWSFSAGAALSVR